LFALGSRTTEILTYDADGQGSGWGIGDPANLIAHWLEHQDADSLTALSWLDAATLAKAELKPGDVGQLLSAAGKDETAKRLVRRYVSYDHKRIDLTIDQWPDWLKRDAALRELARRQYWNDDPLSDLVTKSSDSRIIRATLATNAAQSEAELIGLL